MSRSDKNQKENKTGQEDEEKEMERLCCFSSLVVREVLSEKLTFE